MRLAGLSKRFDIVTVVIGTSRFGECNGGESGGKRELPN